MPCPDKKDQHQKRSKRKDISPIDHGPPVLLSENHNVVANFVKKLLGADVSLSGKISCLNADTTIDKASEKTSYLINREVIFSLYCLLIILLEASMYFTTKKVRALTETKGKS